VRPNSPLTHTMVLSSKPRCAKSSSSVASRPVHPRELHGAIYGLLGIDPDGPLPNGKGLDVNVADGSGVATKRLAELV